MYNAGGAVLAIEYAPSAPAPDLGAGAAAPPAVNGAPALAQPHSGWQMPHATVTVRGAGDFMAYASRQPTRVLVNSDPSTFEFSALDGRLTVPLTSGPSPSKLEVYL